MKNFGYYNRIEGKGYVKSASEVDAIGVSLGFWFSKILERLSKILERPSKILEIHKIIRKTVFFLP